MFGFPRAPWLENGDSGLGVVTSAATSDTGVGVYFNANNRVSGWADLATGENVGGPGEVRPACPARGALP